MHTALVAEAIRNFAFVVAVMFAALALIRLAQLVGTSAAGFLLSGVPEYRDAAAHASAAAFGLKHVAILLAGAVIILASLRV